jgi:hypothetical protein
MACSGTALPFFAFQKIQLQRLAYLLRLNALLLIDPLKPIGNYMTA